MDLPLQADDFRVKKFAAVDMGLFRTDDEKFCYLPDECGKADNKIHTRIVCMNYFKDLKDLKKSAEGDAIMQFLRTDASKVIAGSSSVRRHSYFKYGCDESGKAVRWVFEIPIRTVRQVDVPMYFFVSEFMKRVEFWKMHALEMASGEQTSAFAIGFHTIKGESRHAMEDYSIAEVKKVKELDGLFAIYGHRPGHMVAEYLQHNLFNNSGKETEFFSNPKLAIQKAYKLTDEDILQEAHKLGPLP